MKRKLVLGMMLLALVLTSFGVARAGAQDFALVNQTGVEIHAVYVAPSATDNWEEDLLAGRVLKSGQTLNVTFNGDSDAALYDIRVEDEDGGSLEFSKIDLMRASVGTLGADNKAYLK